MIQGRDDRYPADEFWDQAESHEILGLDSREEGLAGRPGVSRLRLYVSAEAHASIEKAAIVIGVGRTGVRSIPVDDAFRMRPDALEAAIAEDREAGWRPFCVAGTLGTTSSSSFDPAEELAAKGIDLDGYTAEAMVDDVFAVADALGYERVSLMGFSWGTLLGQDACRRYPERVARLISIGTAATGGIFKLPSDLDRSLEGISELLALPDGSLLMAATASAGDPEHQSGSLWWSAAAAAGTHPRDSVFFKRNSSSNSGDSGSGGRVATPSSPCAGNGSDATSSVIFYNYGLDEEPLTLGDLLTWAIDTAWSHGPERVWVNTNTLDHAKALPLYQRCGFQPYKQEHKVFDDPRLNGLIAAEATRGSADD